MDFQFGIEHLLATPEALATLADKRVALVGHPASVTQTLTHSLDALRHGGVNVVRAFGPQHGMRGDKQDNMIESADYMDPLHNIPVISLYGEHRRPTPDMLADLDVVLFDLQDVGCRIYTYITTLKYFIEGCAIEGVALWVLDRPNPAGRPIDGMTLVDGEQSFVGADVMPTRHGLTTGELARWFIHKHQYQLDHKIIPMTGYAPDVATWPAGVSWVNPSPNAASVNMARCFPGTVLLEGTTLSEGRGTTIPLEVIGAPDLPISEMLGLLQAEAPKWLAGAMIRPCAFEPTFHKHVGVMCQALQIHTDNAHYQPDEFLPYRLIAGLLKALRILRPDYNLWRHHAYEYELDRIPIDVINGGPGLREWVDDPNGTFAQFDAQLDAEAAAWQEARAPYLIY
ncbi:MAG: exo-beta-N-acetylmuramidase NamZ domain-containing protein [Pseudomonadales bacterium]